jgi:hypothetical protein
MIKGFLSNSEVWKSQYKIYIGLWERYINITIVILDIIRRNTFYLIYNFSGTEICLRFQVDSTQLGSIDRGSLCVENFNPRCWLCCLITPISFGIVVRKQSRAPSVEPKAAGSPWRRKRIPVSDVVPPAKYCISIIIISIMISIIRIKWGCCNPLVMWVI